MRDKTQNEAVKTGVFVSAVIESPLSIIPAAVSSTVQHGLQTLP